MWLAILMMSTIFAHKLFLTNTQIWRLCKAFANGFSVNIR